MKCLTICQPFATLIVTPQAELPAGQTQKRVENRSWATKYRGPLLIHAGKSKKFLDPEDEGRFGAMPFGAIVGKCSLVGCAQVVDRENGNPIFDREWTAAYPWLAKHPHAEGEFCWILEDVQRYERPIPYLGSLGLFDVPSTVIVEARLLGGGGTFK